MTVMQVAAGMMAGCLPAGSCAARIMLFAGGPPTVGSGKVVDMELTEPIRYNATPLLRLTFLHPHSRQNVEETALLKGIQLGVRCKVTVTCSTRYMSR